MEHLLHNTDIFLYIFVLGVILGVSLFNERLLLSFLSFF